jgi:hypothetical protein
MSPVHRPLSGVVVNLSISESNDSVERGFPSWQVNRVTLQFVAALFGQGASVVFGHDWREDGVMEAVYGFARQAQSPVPLSAGSTAGETQPILHNFVPWPDNPYLPERSLERLSATLGVESAGLPAELEGFDLEARADPYGNLYRYVRARGLTYLRHRLNDASHVRICLGGRTAGSAGRYPGVIEEALLALRANKPVYLATFLGGATAQVAAAIEGKQMTDDFCPQSSVDALYTDPPAKEVDHATAADRVVDRASVWREFQDAGMGKLAALNGLTLEENAELLRTPVIDRAIELMLVGLSRIRTNPALGA